MHMSKLKAYILYICTACFFILLVNKMIDNYLEFEWVARQYSAKQSLLQLYKAENIHHEKYGSFTGNVSELNLSLESPLSSYVLALGNQTIRGVNSNNRVLDPINPYSISSVVDKDHFTAFAFSNNDNDTFLDIWMMDERGIPIHLQDDYKLK
jgi:hypothetical protein